MKRIILFLAIGLILASCSTETVEEIEKANLIEQVNVHIDTFQESEILQLTNLHREQMGLSALELDNTVYRYASEHNRYMVGQGTISHDNFDTRANNLLKETDSKGVAENVGIGSEPNANRAFNGWIDSVPHRENIEGDFTHIGISVMTNEEGLTYFTQIFIKK